MPRIYRVYNFASPTTAAPTLVTTGTAIKTMLQLAPPAGYPGGDIVEWGYMLDANPTSAKIELIEVDVAATVTAHVAAGLVKMSAPGDIASALTLGTTATGYTSSGEGTVTAARLLDFDLATGAITPKQWVQKPLDREPAMQASKFTRIRVTATVAVNMACYIEYAEG